MLYDVPRPEPPRRRHVCVGLWNCRRKIVGFVAARALGKIEPYKKYGWDGPQDFSGAWLVRRVFFLSIVESFQLEIFR